MIEIITSKDIENMYLTNDSGVFTPLFTYKLYNEETDSYVGFEITKTAEEVYQEWLKQKDLPPQPSEMELLKQKLVSLEEQQTVLKEKQALFEASQTTQDLLIDDIVFEVIPSLENQIATNNQNGEVAVLINKHIEKITKNKKGSDGMAGYLARKIIEGRDYKAVFKINAYKQYQDEVDIILELEGRSDLIKRGILG